MHKIKKETVQKWVSHNKVLIGSGDGGGNKKPHARNPNFDSEETKLLIQLWGDPQVQRTLITVHKKHPVISRIAENMRKFGYNRSTEEINTRIKNLKCLYNRIKKDLDSGLLNESSWKHYNAMHEILSRPVFGNSGASTNNKLPTVSKIVISPSSASAIKSETTAENALFKVKEEEISEDEDLNDSSMEFDGSELRPEDLLSVIEAEHDTEVNIKEEPMEVATITEIKASEIENLDMETSSPPKDDTSTTTASAAASVVAAAAAAPLVSIPTTMNRNIVNYANDSLSITSVQGSANSNEPASIISPKLSSQANKISLVPTKLLLKPQAVNGFKQTSHIVTSSSTATVITSNAQNSSSIPMKVVFVNALNSNAQQAAKQHLTLNKTLTQQLQQQTATSQAFIANKILSTGQQQKVQLVNQLPSTVTTPRMSASTLSVNNINNNNNNSVSVSGSSSTANNKSSHHHHHQSSAKSSKTLLGNKLPVIRNLLTNIVEIENQRLEIEKQRFEYEKKVGNELLTLFKTFVQTNASSSSPSPPPPPLSSQADDDQLDEAIENESSI